jgi:hypothetical protein
MDQVLENELLGYCLRPLGEQAGNVAEALSDDEAEAWRQTLANFLLAEAAQGDASPIQISTVEVPAIRDFKSVLYRDEGIGGSKKIVAFNFRDAAVETALPLLGIAIIVFTGKWGIAILPQIGGVLKTLWSKLVVLKRPDDAEAIDVLEALVRVRARHVTSEHAEYPTGAELKHETDMASDLVKRALARLKAQGVIEAVSWGGQSEDVGHLGNRWRIKL